MRFERANELAVGDAGTDFGDARFRIDPDQSSALTSRMMPSCRAMPDQLCPPPRGEMRKPSAAANRTVACTSVTHAALTTRLGRRAGLRPFHVSASQVLWKEAASEEIAGCHGPRDEARRRSWVCSAVSEFRPRANARG